MANKTISMLQVRMILQHLSRGFSQRQIAQQLQLSRNTVKHYVDRLQQSPYSLSELARLDDEQLKELVYPPAVSCPPTDPRRSVLQQSASYFLSELKRKGVTRRLLWEEYRQQYPEGYSYSQFCERLSGYQQIRQASMHFEYTPGELMMIDFAGDQLSYVDQDTGEMINCPVFICSLPYSGYTYVTALANATIPQVVKALNESLAYFGGPRGAVFLWQSSVIT